MSVFVLKCKNCGHKFYDIVVLCTGENIEDKCPKCNSKKLSVSKMEKPKDKIWAEDEGCHHGDPKDFIKGKSKSDSKSPCTNCTHKNTKTNTTIDEEIDTRVELMNLTEQSFKFPKKLHKKFKKPWGEVLNKAPLIPKNEIIITVGDISTKELLSKFYTPNLSIIDNIVNRKKLTKKDKIDHKFFDTVFKVKNEPSTISHKVYKLIEKINLNGPNSVLIDVDGEEDLLTLVCMLHSPIGSHIFYGQPNEGLVHVVVTKKIKYEAEELYNQFV